jgi:transcription-repair coupling factor (superfamily II helicase)
MKPSAIFNPPLPQHSSEQIRWEELYGSGLGCAIYHAAKQHNGLTVVITQDTLAASRLEDELTFFESRSTPSSLLHFPDWETLPYDRFSPHQDIISERLKVLSQLPDWKRGVLIAPITTLMQRLPPRQYIEATTFNLSKGDTINIIGLRQRLARSGYRCVNQVMEHGEFAVRGSIIDLFPMGSDVPYRIDLFDQDIDTIRTFNPETQLSLENKEGIHLLPAREFPVTEEAITLFRQQWRDQFTGNPALCPLYQDISQGFATAGIEYYLPLFFDTTQTLFNYLPSDCLVIQVLDIHHAAEQHWKEINERYEQRRHDNSRPLLAPSHVFLPVDEIFRDIHQFPRIKIQNELSLNTVGVTRFGTIPSPSLAFDSRAIDPLNTLKSWLASSHHRVLFCAETAGRREVLLDLFHKSDINPITFETWNDFINSDASLGITIAPIEQGLQIDMPPIAIIAESQLYGQRVIQRRRASAQAIDIDAMIKDLAELHAGSAVVHLDHGIGRYCGLQTLKVGEREAEYLTLEYSGGDKLYVPVSSLHLISRYSGAEGEHAPLHKLGTEQWTKAKRKAAEQLRDIAAELLDIYARRAARKGHSFKEPAADYFTFANAFPFETTPDQQKAIDEVIKDMTSGQPMDRLICGDVGFGKTEVAMRAAFIAVQEGKQVAVLVPTTLLAMQHHENFKNRFADWPITIDVISRFRTRTEQDEVIKKVKEHKLDILIGTHKLLQSQMQFKTLGLVIIDEEHRFGVQQKERLKSMRSEVDILTLTATPIPRTLNMALAGMRELSIIATPPARRLSIKTFVHDYDAGLIREAILRETLRGGQVYFVHNHVETIEKLASELQTIVPEVKISVAHGQMHERNLEMVMANFYHQRFNVLLCSTIIENGIDIPTANTIIINRADKFGLAQLHQLRGRVGRSHHQAYAYLLLPPDHLLTSDAEKRLEAITSLEDLGVGFALATHDLEIRGAGELLGEDQSGEMQAIGFSLYMELLEQAVNTLRSGKEPDFEKPLHHGAEIDLQFATLIPENYLADAHARLILYKRIANAKSTAALDEIQVEMIDRFGLLPDPTKQLFLITELKLQANMLGIRKIEGGAKGGRIEFEEKPSIDPVKIIQLIQRFPKQYQLDGPTRLRYVLSEPADSAIVRVQSVSKLLEMFRDS